MIILGILLTLRCKGYQGRSPWLVCQVTDMRKPKTLRDPPGERPNFRPAIECGIAVDQPKVPEVRRNIHLVIA
jgi:hypothetical protein